MTASFSSGLIPLAFMLFNRSYSITVQGGASCGSVTAQPVSASLDIPSSSITVQVKVTPSCTGTLDFLVVTFNFTPSPLLASISIGNLNIPVTQQTYTIYIIDQIVEPNTASKA